MLTRSDVLLASNANNFNYNFRKFSPEHTARITKIIAEFVARDLHGNSATHYFTSYSFGHDKDIQIAKMAVCFSPISEFEAKE